MDWAPSPSEEKKVQKLSVGYYRRAHVRQAMDQKNLAKNKLVEINSTNVKRELRPVIQHF